MQAGEQKLLLMSSCQATAAPRVLLYCGLKRSGWLCADDTHQRGADARAAPHPQRCLHNLSAWVGALKQHLLSG